MSPTGIVGAGELRMQKQRFVCSHAATITPAAAGSACASGQHSRDTGSRNSASSAASTGSVAPIHAIEHRRPPLSKKPRTAEDRYTLESGAAVRSKSAKLVIDEDACGVR